MHIIIHKLIQIIKVWDLETGNAIFEYGDAHGDQAITALTFDSTGRRYGLNHSFFSFILSKHIFFGLCNLISL